MKELTPLYCSNRQYSTTDIPSVSMGPWNSRSIYIDTGNTGNEDKAGTSGRKIMVVK